MLAVLAWLLAGSLAVEPPPRPTPRPTRVELGLAAGDYVYSVGSPTQLHYAPAFDLRLAYGLARIGGLGFVRVATPIDTRGSIGTTQQVSIGGGLGLRSMFVRRRWFEFGMTLTTVFDRLDSTTRLPELPGLDEPEHVQRRVTHHAGIAIGNEFGIPLPTRRGPSVALTLGTSLAFVFPIAASRRGSDVEDTDYGTRELGVIGRLGGATVLVELGVTLGWIAP